MATLIDLGLIVCSESAVVGRFHSCRTNNNTGASAWSVDWLNCCKLLCIGLKQLPSAKQALEEQLQRYSAKLDKAACIVIEKINQEFDRLGDLTKAAFDLENNTRLLESSLALATAYNVDESKLIHSDKELDSFMLG